jgi:hypothetical protein
MTQKYDIRLEGNLVAVSPIAVIQPESSKEEAGFNRMPVMENGMRVQKAFINGGGLKSMLRKAAIEAALRAGASGGPDGRVNLDTILHSGLGGIGFASTNATALTNVAKVRQINPIVSLFGAAEPVPVHSLLSVGNAVSQDQAKDVHFLLKAARKNPFRDRPELLDDLSEEDFERYQVMEDGAKDRGATGKVKRKLEKEFKDLKNSLRTETNEATKQDSLRRMHELTIEINAIGEAHGKSISQAGNTIGRADIRRNGIIEGAILNHRYHLLGASEVDVGTLLAGLREATENLRIGSWDALGWGAFRTSYSVFLRPSRGTWQEVGVLEQNQFDFSMPPALDPFIAAFEAAAPNFDMTLAGFKTRKTASDEAADVEGAAEAGDDEEASAPVAKKPRGRRPAVMAAE